MLADTRSRSPDLFLEINRLSPQPLLCAFSSGIQTSLFFPRTTHLNRKWHEGFSTIRNSLCSRIPLLFRNLEAFLSVPCQGILVFLSLHFGHDKVVFSTVSRDVQLPIEWEALVKWHNYNNNAAELFCIKIV